MKKIDRLLTKLLLYGLPVVLCLIVFSTMYGRGVFKGLTDSLSIINSFTGLMLATWMILTVYLSIRLLISQSYRDEILTKVLFIKERDERELYLTGRATKTVFLMTTALLLFLLCLSCFQVNIYRVPQEKAINGKTGMVSLGAKVDIFKSSVDPAVNKEGVERVIFQYSALPISVTGIILLFLIWNVSCYHYLMHRLVK